MKNIIFYVILILLATAVVSFFLGYYKVGMGTGVLLMMICLGAANVFSVNNEEYVYKTKHNDYRTRKK